MWVFLGSTGRLLMMLFSCGKRFNSFSALNINLIKKLWTQKFLRNDLMKQRWQGLLKWQKRLKFKFFFKLRFFLDLCFFLYQCLIFFQNNRFFLVSFQKLFLYRWMFSSRIGEFSSRTAPRSSCLVCIQDIFCYYSPS